MAIELPSKYSQKCLGTNSEYLCEKKTAQINLKITKYVWHYLKKHIFNFVCSDCRYPERCQL